MNKITVFFFAVLRDKAGVKQTFMEIPSNTNISEFKTMVVERFPKITNSMESTLISVNKEVAFDDDIIPDGAEVALFPPVSGG
jgi:molybdopterin converting factor subunit 1